MDGCADADDARILATEGVVVPERGSGDGRRDVGQTDDEIVRSPSCTTVDNTVTIIYLTGTWQHG